MNNSVVKLFCKKVGKRLRCMPDTKQALLQGLIDELSERPQPRYRLHRRYRIQHRHSRSGCGGSSGNRPPRGNAARRNQESAANDPNRWCYHSFFPAHALSCNFYLLQWSILRCRNNSGGIVMTMEKRLFSVFFTLFLYSVTYFYLRNPFSFCF